MFFLIKKLQIVLCITLLCSMPLYAQDHHQDVMLHAEQEVVAHPQDGDKRLLLAKLYFDKQKYKAASEQLIIILRAYPHYVDARLVLINLKMQQKNYDAALTLVNEGLLLDADNQALLHKRHIIQRAIQDERSKAARHAALVVSDVREPYKKPEPQKYLNMAGVFQQQYYISDRHQVWDYSTLFYGRETGVGMLFGKVTYNNRLSYQSVQGEIEAYPQINKYLYLDLDFSFANEPNLFPDKAYGAEAYVSRLPWFDFSFGFKYNDVNHNHQFAIYSGSVSKQFENYRLLFRPYHFVPSAGKTSTLYILDVRRVVADPYFYFGCIIGTGTTPDLANLVTIDFIVLQNKIFNPYINFPLLNDRLSVNLGALAQNQVFENGHVRNWYGGTIGLTWKY